MKRRFVTLSVVLALTLSMILAVSGCKKKAGGDAVALIPEDASGVFIININKFAQLPLFDSIIKDSEKKEAEKPGSFFKNYKDFIDKTGLDPKKDIFSVAVGIMGKVGPTGKTPDVVAVANLNYNKDKIMALAKQESGKVTEENYNGINILRFKDDEDKDMALAFISDKILSAGAPDAVKKVIDLSKGKGKSVADKMKPYMDKVNPGAIFSFLFEIPQEARKVQDSGMFKLDFTKAEAVIGNVDYANKTWTGLIQLISKNEQANQQLATTLNGFKGMGAMAGPEFGELVNKINITATSDAVKMDVSIPDELLEKIKTKIEEKNKMTPPPPAPGTPQEPQAQEPPKE